jgi:hypothetical protein
MDSPMLPIKVVEHACGRLALHLPRDRPFIIHRHRRRAEDDKFQFPACDDALDVTERAVDGCGPVA